MFRLIIKFIMYSIILWLSAIIGLVPEFSTETVLVLAAVLAGVNTLIRPVLTAVALPFNFITFGIASVFANLLSLVIANAIVGKPIAGFWVMLLIAFVVMLADDLHRIMRGHIRRRLVRPLG
ncbi:MAG: phage holin family protein [Eubacteriales bacterium]